ncbi:MAG: four helix bundle protein [Verrucomicrobiota bacterium]|nr:four helix bundle protein [Verrucomicrobiota bacterium]
MAQFRFQNLEIWKRAIDIADKLLDIAVEMDDRKYYRFSDQLRGAALSISNNIAEGAGSSSKKEFAQFLNFAKRSCFENANMLILFCKRGLVTEELRDSQLKALEEESKMIEAFRKSLLGGYN